MHGKRTTFASTLALALSLLPPAACPQEALAQDAEATDDEPGLELREEVRADDAAQGALRVTSPLPGVTVLVDDRELGTTPLDSALPVAAGEHVVIGRRPGYHEARATVEVEVDGERDVELVLLRDPNADVETGLLRFWLPHDATVAARIDGEIVELGQDIEVPVGDHAVQLEVANRQPWTGQAYVERDRAEDVQPTLRWTPDERAARLDAAGLELAAGIGVFAGSAALAVGSLVPAIWNETRASDADAELELLEDCVRRAGGGGDPGLYCADFGTREPANAALRREIQDLRIVTLVGAATGLIGVALGLWLWSSAPTAADVDAAASARLDVHVGPGGVTVSGRF